MKNASPAPISNPPAARCQIPSSSDSESSPRTSRTAARTRSAASMTSRWGSRSAATPPISTNASRPTLNRAVISESSVGPPPSSITCHASATSHSPLPTSEIASPVHSRRKSRWRRGRNAVGTPPSTVTTPPSRTASPLLSACLPLYFIRPSSSARFVPSFAGSSCGTVPGLLPRLPRSGSGSSPSSGCSEMRDEGSPARCGSTRP
jgi:hypothetical protein